MPTSARTSGAIKIRTGGSSSQRVSHRPIALCTPVGEEEAKGENNCRRQETWAKANGQIDECRLNLADDIEFIGISVSSAEVLNKASAKAPG